MGSLVTRVTGIPSCQFSACDVLLFSVFDLSSGTGPTDRQTDRQQPSMHYVHLWGGGITRWLDMQTNRASSFVSPNILASIKNFLTPSVITTKTWWLFLIVCNICAYGRSQFFCDAGAPPLWDGSVADPVETRPSPHVTVRNVVVLGQMMRA